jgi:hypothetical protein
VPTAPARLLGLPFLAILFAFSLAAVAFATESWPTRTGLHQLMIWTVVVPATAGFLIGYRRLLATPAGPGTRRTLVFGAVPLWAAALVVPPFDSLDLAGYVNNGFLQVGLGINPYVVPVTEVPHWWLYPELRAYWPGTVCAYGPLFAEVAAVVVAASCSDRFLVFLLFKLLNLAALALTIWLVDRGCRRAGTNQALGLYLIAWNPLVLLHGISNGHNDVLVGLGLVVALVAAVERLWWAVLPALAVAALIKYATLPLFPLAAVFLVRRHGWARTAVSAGLAVGLIALSSWPYLAEGSAVQVTRNVGNVTRFVNSLGSVVYVPVEAIGKKFSAAAPVGEAVATGMKAAGALAVLGLVAVLAWWRVRARRYTWHEFVSDAVLVQFVMIVFASSKFYAWYLLMFWPAVVWLPDASRLRRATLAVGLAQMGSFTFLSRAHVVSPLVLIALPLLLYRRWERRRGEPSAAPLAFPKAHGELRRRAA